MDKKYIPVYLAGRCRSGSDSTGTVIHAFAVTGDDSEICGDPGPALCGRPPARRSAGWYSLPSRPTLDGVTYSISCVTCQKCKKLMEEKND